MTCELAYDGHDCSARLACLRAAVAVGERALERPREERQRQRPRDETVEIVWPDSPFWSPRA